MASFKDHLFHIALYIFHICGFAFVLGCLSVNASLDMIPSAMLTIPGVEFSLALVLIGLNSQYMSGFDAFVTLHLMYMLRTE